MRILLFVFLLMVTASAAKAQPAALRDGRILPPSPKVYNPFVATARKTMDRYIRNYNNDGYPIVEMKFKNFRPLPPDLEADLYKAFKNHVFSVVETRFKHHGWSDGPDYIIIIERKSGRVMYISSNPINGTGNPIDSLAGFLSLYPAKDTDDALFKVKTFTKIVALSDGKSIGNIRLKDGTISTLICHGSPSLLDMGLTFKVDLDKRYRFGKLYFDKNTWERNKCPVTSANNK